MEIHVDQTNPSPLYEQIATQIADQILSGQLQPGAELPSIRKLASDLVISVITIKRAYQELESKGLIVTRPGIGSRVAEFTAADLHAMKLKKLRQQLRDVVRHAQQLQVDGDTLQKLLRDIIYESEDGRYE